MKIFNPSIYIIILNWNQFDLTSDCLKSLKNIKYNNYKIIVIDNGSVDDSLERLMFAHPNVKYIRNGTNLGFTDGNNVGIEFAIANNADYVYLLNNDTEVDEYFLSTLVPYFEADKSVAIAGSTVFYFDRPDIVWFAGAKANWNTGDMVDQRVNKVFNNNVYLPIEVVDEVAGAGMMISTSFLKSFGNLDSRFFIYFEETDLCQRAIKNKFKVIWVPESHIWHKVSMAFGDQSPLMIYFMTRNRWLFMKKHCLNFNKFILYYYYRNFKVMIKLLVSMKFKNLNATFYGMLDAIRGNYGSGSMSKFSKK